jgi:hypothetical protein
VTCYTQPCKPCKVTCILHYLPQGGESSPRGGWGICAPALPEVLTLDFRPVAATPTIKQADEVLRLPFQVRTPHHIVCTAPQTTGARGKAGDTERHQGVANERTLYHGVRLASDWAAKDLMLPHKFQF